MLFHLLMDRLRGLIFLLCLFAMHAIAQQNKKKVEEDLWLGFSEEERAEFEKSELFLNNMKQFVEGRKSNDDFGNKAKGARFHDVLELHLNADGVTTHAGSASVAEANIDQAAGLKPNMNEEDRSAQILKLLVKSEEVRMKICEGFKEPQKQAACKEALSMTHWNLHQKDMGGAHGSNAEPHRVIVLSDQAKRAIASTAQSYGDRLKNDAAGGDANKYLANPDKLRSEVYWYWKKVVQPELRRAWLFKRAIRLANLKPQSDRAQISSFYKMAGAGPKELVPYILSTRASAEFADKIPKKDFEKIVSHPDSLKELESCLAPNQYCNLAFNAKKGRYEVLKPGPGQDSGNFFHDVEEDLIMKFENGFSSLSISQMVKDFQNLMDFNEKTDALVGGPRDRRPFAAFMAFLKNTEKQAQALHDGITIGQQRFFGGAAYADMDPKKATLEYALSRMNGAGSTMAKYRKNPDITNQNQNVRRP